jgi:ABC-type sugar transport system permease subunit
MPLTHRRRNTLTYAAFLALPVVLFIGAFIYPVVDTLVLSFYKWDGFSPRSYVGWANYAMLFHQPRFLHALANNGKWLLYYLFIPTLAGLGLALLLDTDLRGGRFFRTVFFLPFTITTVAVASVWRWLYNADMGAINEVLRALGLDALAMNWLGDPHINTYAIMLASLWSWSGFTFLIYFAGLRGIPTEYIEAAKIDGAGPLTILTRIKLPLLLPSTIVILGIAGVDSMRVFDLVWATTQGGPFQSSTVLAVEMYDASFNRTELGTGAAIAVCLLLLSAVVVLPYLYVLSARVAERQE